MLKYVVYAFMALLVVAAVAGFAHADSPFNLQNGRIVNTPYGQDVVYRNPATNRNFYNSLNSYAKSNDVSQIWSEQINMGGSKYQGTGYFEKGYYYDPIRQNQQYGWVFHHTDGYSQPATTVAQPQVSNIPYQPAITLPAPSLSVPDTQPAYAPSGPAYVPSGYPTAMVGTPSLYDSNYGTGNAIVRINNDFTNYGNINYGSINVGSYDGNGYGGYGGCGYYCYPSYGYGGYGSYYNPCCSYGGYGNAYTFGYARQINPQSFGTAYYTSWGS